MLQSITRQHFIRPHPGLRGLFSIVGGKLTTYRSLAEQTVDLILKKLPSNSDRGRLTHSFNCLTDHDPLPGAATTDFDTFCANFKQHSRLPEATNDRLLRIYGMRVSLLLNLIDKDASLAKVFDSENRRAFSRSCLRIQARVCNDTRRLLVAPHHGWFEFVAWLGGS